ncbi:MAG: SprT-like domain-containing protein [Steroidobacteraceae bacterium]
MTTTETSHRLSVELERAALRALAETYDVLNVSHFKRALGRPLLELVSSGARFGCWVRERRTIELGRTLLVNHGWGVIVEVLKHEMAHQYVDEVLGLHEQTAHGPAFSRVCAERAIDARASGVPIPHAAPSSEARVLERVAKLLALAESPNVHEAEVAMSTAQRLMLKYNIESALGDPRRTFGFRHLGTPSGRVHESSRILATILTDHFFVEGIWVPVWRPSVARRGSVLEICGTHENLELSAYVYSFLTHTAEKLWRDHKRRHGIRRDLARRTFVSGVMTGFRDKLASESRASEERGLVWVGDAELADYFRRRHPRVRRRLHYGRGRSEEWAHGRAAGRRIVLHRGVEAGASRDVPLLPGRGGE